MKKNELINSGIKLGLDKKVIDLIITKTTGFNKNQLFLLDEIEDKYFYDIENAFNKVISGFPLEYLLENANFYSLDFYVDDRVLIPRNDTEVMVSEVLKIINERDILIDVGTGSGCIPISIVRNINTKYKSYALDISDKALEVCMLNIEIYKLKNKVDLIKSDLLDVFLISTIKGNELFLASNLVITANLPYIKDGDFENMDSETVKYEPDLSLYGGKETGFEMYERLINQCFEIKSIYKIKKVILFIEIGFDQKDVSKKFLNKNKLGFQIFKDNGSIDRCIKIEF